MKSYKVVSCIEKDQGCGVDRGSGVVLPTLRGRRPGRAEVRWLITRRISALPSCYHLEVIQEVDALTYMTNFLLEIHVCLRSLLIK